ncbi:hypothetical protein ACTGV3_10350 [Streptococcus suis]
MRKFFQDLNQEYLETRSSVGEDWLEWIIQRKMTWGMRWGVVGILMFVLQPLTYNPHFLLWLRASFSRREKQENHQLCWWLPRL